MAGGDSASSAKGALYAQSVDLARRQGLFASATVADAKGKVQSVTVPGAGMDWKELLRKFSKHNPQREAAHADQTIHNLLAKSPSAPTIPSTSLPHLPPTISAGNISVVHVAVSSLDNALSSATGSNADKDSARIVKSFGLYSVGEFDQCLKELQRVDKDIPNQSWEAYDLTLRVAANAYEGYALEHVKREKEAITAYGKAGRVYDEACEALKRAGVSTKDDIELHRIGEQVLFRLCLWSKLAADPHQAYQAHRIYINRAESCPITNSPFTSTHVVRVLTAFRELIHATNRWDDLSVANRTQESILRRSTKLPMAGDVNVEYVRFLDQVAQGWIKSGAGIEGAQEVVNIMYNALTHTFQSHRLLRHLSRALVALGRHEEAGKALKLYFELFNKSKETDPTIVAREMRKFRQAEHNNGSTTMETDKDTRQDVESDADSDYQFVETVTFAVRVFVKYLDEPDRAVEMAKRAREIFDDEKSELKGDAKLESKLERALGIALGAQAAKDQNPDTRPGSQTEALTHLDRAHQLDPTSWQTLYHLAYQLAELRQITPALDKARQAVELSSRSKAGSAYVDAWHLLGLLVAAQKETNEALVVLETAIDDGDSDDDDDETTTRSKVTQSNGTGRFLNVVDSKLTKLSLNDQGSNKPSIECNFELFRDETEQLVSQVQLRMTRNVIIEIMEGPEASLLDQQALLSYFSSAYNDIKHHPVMTTSCFVENGDAGTTNVALADSGASMRRTASVVSRPRSIRGLVSRSKADLTQPTTTEDTPDSPMIATNGANMPSVVSNKKATKLLVDLWLMSSASYRRAGKLSDAQGAIAEAEKLDPDDADVWVQLALLNVARGDETTARTCLHKALSCEPDHPAALLSLARLYISPCQVTASTNNNQVVAVQDNKAVVTKTTTTSVEAIDRKLPFAEGILETLTKRHGWDSPEAWFELSKCFNLKRDKLGRRLERERECLVWALQLEETRSVRKWDCVPRVL
ncbi:hypothetical protein OIO90_000968 [Microbotryomycetes sp. JL221]|nr:hypothetical protein OIO90_000968 [Microbotryomycetes sp. JL221]